MKKYKIAVLDDYQNVALESPYSGVAATHLAFPE
jgi:hypothetical protein